MPIQLADVFTRLRNDGYSTFPLADLPIEQMLKYFQRQRYFVSHTHLTIKSRDAHVGRRTLSNIYGEGEFPFHTDYAFRSTSPQYIVLVNGTDKQSTRPTMVAPFSKLPLDVLELLKKACWLLASNETRFVLSSAPIQHGTTAYRWDVDCLSPFNEFARAASDCVPDHLRNAMTLCHWQPQCGLIIDNWKVAHARAAGDVRDSSCRTLTRYEVWKHA